MSNVRTCADCSTQYALDLAACPHCGSSNYREAEGVVVKRLPLFVSLHCPECGRGPWTVRLQSIASGLIDLPTLACASCGSRVPVTWPPEEEPMSPKITVHNGATNARAADVSPAADASQPQVVAEDDLGLLTSADQDAVLAQDADEVAEVRDEPDAVAPDYDGMTLAELREEASRRELPSYGNKAQIIERLKESDGASDEE